MDELSTRLSRLGKAVADVSDRSADPNALDAARRRFVGGEPLATPSRRRAVAMFAAAACVAAVAVVFVRERAHPPALSFEVGSPPVPGTVGAWVAARDDVEALPLRFSDASQISLSPGARVRVLETTARGARVLLESGAMEAAIVHRDRDTAWALRAGPFEVRVTGTAFDVAWDAPHETFDLVMREGAVLVSGPLLPPERSVVAGEHLRIAVRDGRMELTRAGDRAAAPAAAEVDPVAASAAASAPPDVAAPPSSASASGAPPVRVPTWRELAAAGKYRDAFEAADHSGFSQEVEHASSGELLMLSDAARFAGHPDKAREALLAMRRRFGDRGRSAFLLGKIAADQQNSYGDAVAWFETYLAEEPNGPLAEQALGRLLELKKTADPEGARSIAERYLARYPTGAYAALAQRLADH